MKSFIWLSFDLGVRGDYEGMYRWLDSHGAKECGDSVACFWYQHAGELYERIKRDLASSVELKDKKVRIYVIRLLDGKMQGKFIFGNRRSAPWTGFAGNGEESDDSSS